MVDDTTYKELTWSGLSTRGADLVSTALAEAADQFHLDGAPTTFRESTMGPLDITVDAAALSTGVMHATAVVLQPGDVVTNITVKSGATAAAVPTNYWFALYSSAATPALLAQTADQTTTAWGANTVKTLALTAAQTITSAGVYYVGIMVTATTPPSILAHDYALAGATASILSSKALAQTSGSGLTTTAPATIATPTASRYGLYAILT